jgi:Pyruvate/2-oxoacid:ferredoxin oxidoreductase gamma subunit
MEIFEKLTGRSYQLFEYHGDPQAERIIIIMGSGAGTVGETVKYLNNKGEKTGYLTVHLFRPFSIAHFVKAIPTSVKQIAVLDRCKETGAIGEPLYMDVINALHNGWEGTMPKVIGGRYGLASKEFTPAMVKAIFEELTKAKPKNGFTIGIEDDITHTSLAYDKTFGLEDQHLFRGLFFGLGADGTVSANKNTIKIIGDVTDNHVQAYFVYDSKKSGSLTVSHLRFSENPIHSTYLINSANFIACHHFHYLETFDILKDAEPGATFLLNAPFKTEALECEDWRDIDTPLVEAILNPQLSNVKHVEMDPSTGAKMRYTSEQAAEENERKLDQLNELRTSNDMEPLDVLPSSDAVDAGDVIEISEGHLVKEWAYVFLGRLLYELNVLDSWQVLPMFVGRAGTGKSVLLTTAAKFFEESDVAVVSNDGQKTFGLETIYDKMLWMCKEVKADMTLDQAQLQSMITGEEMSITRKGRTSLQVVWRSPGIIAGNELATWSDNSGSMSRRLILFYFNTKVSDSDPHLQTKLRDEIPSLIHKCALAYAEAVKLYGNRDLWSMNPYLKEEFRKDPEYAASYRGSRGILPSYFHQNKSGLKQATHLMENFLANSDNIIIKAASEEIGMPWDVDEDDRESFKTIASKYFKKQDPQARFPWNNKDKWLATLQDYGLQRRQLEAKDISKDRGVFKSHHYPAGTWWLFGITLKSEYAP